MSRITPILLGITMLLSATVQAQLDLSGTWEGKLVVAPGQEIDVRFTFNQGQDGAYSGVLNAPDQPSLTDVPLDAISLQADALSVAVGTVSGNYEGRIVGDAIEGTWSQQGSDFVLNLTPYEEPVLTAEAFARIEGSWIGTLNPIPGGSLEFSIVIRLVEEEGEFNGYLSVPEQGANNLSIDSIALEGDELVLAINQIRSEIVGSLTGEGFVGKWNQAGQSLDLALARGEYEQTGLNLSALNYARLRGPWHGKIGPLTVVLRVEEVDGKYLAFLDSPDQGSSDIPVPTLNLDGDEFDLAIDAMNAAFSATIDGEEIAGEWTQAGQRMPLTLVRGPYVPSVDLPVAAQQRLAGRWHGSVNDTELVFRFESGADGAFAAYLDLPSLGMSDLPLTGLSLDGDELSFVVGGIAAQFSGALADEELRGTWARNGAENDLLLQRQ